MFETFGWHSWSQCWALSGELLVFLANVALLVAMVAVRVLTVLTALCWAATLFFRLCARMAERARTKQAAAKAKEGFASRPPVVPPTGPTSWKAN